MVLLGFIDEPKGNKTIDDDPSNWTISRIGGEPAFPTSNLFDEFKSKLICSKCKFDKVFVCQLYCPLDGHRYDRSIYLFACRNPSCWNQSERFFVDFHFHFHFVFRSVGRQFDVKSSTNRSKKQLQSFQIERPKRPIGVTMRTPGTTTKLNKKKKKKKRFKRNFQQSLCRKFQSKR